MYKDHSIGLSIINSSRHMKIHALLMPIDIHIDINNSYLCMDSLDLMHLNYIAKYIVDNCLKEIVKNFVRVLDTIIATFVVMKWMRVLLIQL